MKHTLSLLLLATFILATSFKIQDEDDKYKGTFSALLNGHAFTPYQEQLFRGLLMQKAAGKGGAQRARTVINTTFSGLATGATRETGDGNITFEIDYTGAQTGKAADYTISLQHNGRHYQAVKEHSQVYITALVWQSDKKQFLVCAFFDCKMRSTANPADGKNDISLKGEMKNIRITVPGWMAVNI